MIYGLRRMIYLLRKHDIISVPFIREAFIICEADIIPAGYITRSARNGYHLKKSHLSVDKCDFFCVSDTQSYVQDSVIYEKYTIKQTARQIGIYRTVFLNNLL